MRRVVVWASGRGWAEDGMARAIRELHGHAGDLSCEIWGPHDVYFFRNICRIMEPFRNFFRGRHFAKQVCPEIQSSNQGGKGGFGRFFGYYYYYYIATRTSLLLLLPKPALASAGAGGLRPPAPPRGRLGLLGVC